MDKTKEVSVKAFDKTKEVIGAVAANEKVQAFGTKTAEIGKGLWGWIKKNTVGEEPEP